MKKEHEHQVKPFSCGTVPLRAEQVIPNIGQFPYEEESDCVLVRDCLLLLLLNHMLSDITNSHGLKTVLWEFFFYNNNNTIGKDMN
jgi:hypothetical protein